MSKTQTEFIARVLNKLGVIGAGQSPATEDTTVVTAEIVPVMADLATRGVYAWGDPDAIEDDAFIHLADVVANSLARDYGKEQDEQLRLMAESRLRQLSPAALSYQPARNEYY